MNAPNSDLSRRIRNKYRKEISERIKNGTLIGSKYVIDGKTFIITDGEVNINIEEIIEKINSSLKINGGDLVLTECQIGNVSK